MTEQQQIKKYIDELCSDAADMIQAVPVSYLAVQATSSELLNVKVTNKSLSSRIKKRERNKNNDLDTKEL